MRKFVWMALAAFGLVVAGGLVYAHGGLIHAGSSGSNVSSSTDDEQTCPLRCLMNYFCQCR
jgi:hypothetical protein